MERNWTAALERLQQGEDEREVAEEVIAAIARNACVKQAALIRANPPAWQALAVTKGTSAPLELAADALDGGESVERGEWLATPLGDASDILMLSPPSDRHDAQAIARDACLLLAVASRQNLMDGEASRLRALLKIANDWGRTKDLKSLLERMAETACSLFDCERASIFLWDPTRRTLVGRPALGIEEGELRLPDDAGVVGQVLHAGKPMRVYSHDEGEIDHSADHKTGYHTRSLLCVPLTDPGGRKLGVFELLNKNQGEFTDADQSGLTQLAESATGALATTQQFGELLERHEQMVEDAARGVRLLGECPAMVALRESIDRVADTDLVLLLLGENGVGKDVLARTVHYKSRRRNEPFVAVNCAAIAETLLESELFGHEKGAFTDAQEARAGKFELAAGGTLFLDEIGDMSLGGQAKLLRVLEEKSVVRVGGSETIRTDVRIIAATNQDLARSVREKRFREDLYYRLNGVTLETPPLRQRDKDIMTLADHFLNDFCRATGRRPPRWSAEARKKMLSHRWPGNVRELRNLMERLAYLTTGDRIEGADLAFPSSVPGDRLMDSGLSFAEATSEFQRRYIQEAIDHCQDNVTDAAKQLGVHRSNLYRKMNQLGMGEETDQTS